MTEVQINEIATRLAPTVPADMQDPVDMANYLNSSFPHAPVEGSVTSDELNAVVGRISALRGW